MSTSSYGGCRAKLAIPPCRARAPVRSGPNLAIPGDGSASPEKGPHGVLARVVCNSRMIAEDCGTAQEQGAMRTGQQQQQNWSSGTHWDGLDIERKRRVSSEAADSARRDVMFVSAHLPHEKRPKEQPDYSDFDVSISGRA